MEDYLIYLLREIVPAEPTSNPGQGGSNEIDMKETIFARGKCPFTWLRSDASN